MGNQNKDKWLLSFSGFLMLLFATFVVLFATENNKNQELENKLKHQSENKENLNFKNELVELQKKFESTFIKEAPSLETSITQRGLEVRFLVADFYLENKITPQQDFIPLIDRMGKNIKDSGLSFIVLGHSDKNESELLGDHSFDEWTLSSQRAAWIVSRWIQNFQIDPTLVSIASRAYYEPKAQSEDPLNQKYIQSHNRRVEIIIQPKSTQEES